MELLKAVDEEKKSESPNLFILLQYIQKGFATCKKYKFKWITILFSLRKIRFH